MDEKDEGLTIFAVKTTAGEEIAVAGMMKMKIEMGQHEIASILVPDKLKGYLLVESATREVVEQVIHGINHARAVIKGQAAPDELEQFLTPQPTTVGVKIGNIVEIINGPFRGEKARVKRVDINKEEVTVEFFESTVVIPVTVRGDSIRVLDKEEV